MVHRCLREHGIVLNLGLAQRRAVASNQDELGCTTQITQSTKASRGGEEEDQTNRSAQGPSQPHAPVPRESRVETNAPLLLRICLRADLYPRAYLPDFTTSARRAAMDSVDLEALDFLVGAIAVRVGVGDGGGGGVLRALKGHRFLGTDLLGPAFRFRHLPYSFLKFELRIDPSEPFRTPGTPCHSSL